MQSLDWNDIRYFLAIARAGHLAGAARGLGVNHSTAFRRLNALEEQLGVRLFDRLPHGYALTTAGSDILPLAEQIDEEFATLERKLAGRDFALRGSVRITTAPNIARRYLPRLLAEFERDYPEVRVEIAVSDSDYDLTRREADLALRATPAPPEHLIGRRLATLGWHACASESYLARNEPPADETALGEHPLIGADSAFSRLPVFAWLRSEYGGAIRYRCNDLSTMAALAQEGMGIALLPQDLLGDGLERLFPVCPEATSQLWLLTHPDLRRVARIRALMNFLAERLPQDPRLQPCP